MKFIHRETLYSLEQYKLLNSLAEYRDRITALLTSDHKHDDPRNIKQKRENTARMGRMEDVRKLAKELHANRGRIDQSKVVKLKKKM